MATFLDDVARRDLLEAVLEGSGDEVKRQTGTDQVEMVGEPAERAEQIGVPARGADHPVGQGNREECGQTVWTKTFARGLRETFAQARASGLVDASARPIKPSAAFAADPIVRPITFPVGGTVSYRDDFGDARIRREV